MSPIDVKAKGSYLTTQMWKAWDHYKPMLMIKPHKKAYFLPFHSIWFSVFINNIYEKDNGKAHKLHLLGFYTWHNVWFGATRPVKLLGGSLIKM